MVDDRQFSHRLAEPCALRLAAPSAIPGRSGPSLGRGKQARIAADAAHAVAGVAVVHFTAGDAVSQPSKTSPCTRNDVALVHVVVLGGDDAVAASGTPFRYRLESGGSVCRSCRAAENVVGAKLGRAAGP